MNGSTWNYKIWIYLLASSGLVVVILLSYEFFYRFPIWSLRAFRVSSDSMCPTVCKGERVFVQMRYGNLTPRKEETSAHFCTANPARYSSNA
jgi:signal peptidase I